MATRKRAAKAPAPLVAVMMGSDSDLPVMQRTLDQLDALKIPAEVAVLSAHRTPAQVERFVRTCEKNGVEVFICGAGGAAHLAGAVVAKTLKPVIGVPLDATNMGGLDALLSTVQMPPGLPVATVATSKMGATNAAVLAARILALGHADIRRRLEKHRTDMTAKVLEKNKRVRRERAARG